MKKRKPAFTLIEMAIVLFIISLLMMLILPNLNSQRKNAQKMQAEAMVTTIQTQVDLYQNANDDDSVTFEELQSGGYLSQKQVDKANNLGIIINDNQVTM